MITRTFTPDELDALDLPWSKANVVAKELIGEKRWANVYGLVFRTEPDGPMWMVDYFQPATEATECDCWGYHDRPEVVEAVQVEPYTVEVIKYRPVAPPAEPVEETATHG